VGAEEIEDPAKRRHAAGRTVPSPRGDFLHGESVKSAGGLLDRYVLRRFVGAYGLCLGAFLMLFLVVDFSMRIDNILEAAPNVSKAGYSLMPLVAEFEATKLVWFATFLGPFLSLFAAIATLIAFGRHNELTPMIAAGRSHHRVLAPVYVFAALAAAVFALAEDRVVPLVMKRNAAIENTFEPNRRGDAPPHLRDDSTGNIYSALKWMPAQQRLLDVQVLSYHDPSGRLPDGRLDAAALVFARNKRTKTIGWYPVDGTLTPNVAGAGGALPSVKRLEPDEAVAFRMTPAEVSLKTALAEPGLTHDELATLNAMYKDRYDLRMLMLTRQTRPAASLVLLLLGLPFVLKPGQRTIAAGLGVALCTCSAYMAVDFLCQQLGNRGAIEPLVAAWFAPALFGSLAIARLDRLGG
jgi:lipopolysaccharide export system permease protein